MKQQEWEDASPWELLFPRGKPLSAQNVSQMVWFSSTFTLQLSHNLGENSDQANSQEQMYIKQHIINLKFKQNKHSRAATENSLGCNKETIGCRDGTVLLLLYKPLFWGHCRWLCLTARGAYISKGSPGFPCVYCYLHIISDTGKAVVKEPFF